MKRLILLRHAKAVQTSPYGDHARALNLRGSGDAEAIGREMRARGLEPDLVLCSTATRAEETWDLVAPQLTAAPRVQFTDALYLTPVRTILNLLRETGDAVRALLVIGHNPGLEGAIADLLRTPQNADERARRATLAEKFPTAALAVLDCPIAHWRELEPGKATVSDFLTPRELKG